MSDFEPDFSHGLHVSHDSIICTPQSTRLPKIFSYSPFYIFPFPSWIFTVTVPRLVENIVGFLVAISGSLPTEGNQKKNITTFLSFFSTLYIATFAHSAARFFRGFRIFLWRGTGPRDIVWIVIPLPSLIVVVVSDSSCCCVNCT